MFKKGDDVRKRQPIFLLGLAFLTWVTSLSMSQAAAPTGSGYNEKAVADFYRGKTLRITVGFSAGGGYDQYARLIARHLSKYVPGHPGLSVDNLAEDSSRVAAHHLFNRAPQLGTVIG